MGQQILEKDHEVYQRGPKRYGQSEVMIALPISGHHPALAAPKPFLQLGLSQPLYHKGFGGYISFYFWIVKRIFLWLSYTQILHQVQNKTQWNFPQRSFQSMLQIMKQVTSAEWEVEESALAHSSGNSSHKLIWNQGQNRSIRISKMGKLFLLHILSFFS